MYKSRFTRWNQRKNYTKSEKKDVIDTLKTVHVTGEPRPVPTIRGRKAEMNRIRRYCRQEKILEEFVTLLPRSSIDKRKRMNVTASSYRGRKAHSRERRTTKTLAADSRVCSEAMRSSSIASFDPDCPFSLTYELGRVEIVLTHIRMIFDMPLPDYDFGWSPFDCIAWNRVVADNVLDDLPRLIPGSESLFVCGFLLRGVQLIGKRKLNGGWSLIHQACDMLEEALQNDPACLIVFLMIAFKSQNWGQVPDLRARLWRYITRLALLKHGCNHPLSIIAYHPQEQPIFSGACEAAENIIEPWEGLVKIREEMDKIDEEMDKFDALMSKPHL